MHQTHRTFDALCLLAKTPNQSTRRTRAPPAEQGRLHACPPLRVHAALTCAGLGCVHCGCPGAGGAGTFRALVAPHGGGRCQEVPPCEELDSAAGGRVPADSTHCNGGTSTGGGVGRCFAAVQATCAAANTKAPLARIACATQHNTSPRMCVCWRQSSQEMVGPSHNVRVTAPPDAYCSGLTCAGLCACCAWAAGGEAFVRAVRADSAGLGAAR